MAPKRKQDIDPGQNKLENEREEFQAQLRHTQRLETLGILAGGIAHDFNNLLVSILGNADIALLKLSEDSPLRKYIGHIKTAAIRASGLTNQMLSYAGKGSLRVEPVDVNVLVEEMANLLKVAISKQVTLKLCFTEDLPTIEADAEQVRQVVMNLITNAAEAIVDDHGFVTLSTGVCRKKGEQDRRAKKYVFIQISDTGTGMDDVTKERIFEPFFTTKTTGRGLGLSVTNEIIRAHKGIMKVKGEAGKGTTFTVYFPHSGKPLKEPKEPELPPVDSLVGSWRILIIDDELDVLETTRTMLETRDFTVHTASAGQEGIKFFRRNASDIDIVLMDMTMPSMSGEALYREIRKINAAIPVILSSGYSEMDIRGRFGSGEEPEFIQKPYQLETLLVKINRIMKGK